MIPRHLKIDSPILGRWDVKTQLRHTQTKILVFLKEYKEINKDNELGDLYPWNLNPDFSMLLIIMVSFQKKNLIDFIIQEFKYLSGLSNELF